jgi:hypothetical protein
MQQLLAPPYDPLHLSIPPLGDATRYKCAPHPIDLLFSSDPDIVAQTARGRGLQFLLLRPGHITRSEQTLNPNGEVDTEARIGYQQLLADGDIQYPPQDSKLLVNCTGLYKPLHYRTLRSCDLDPLLQTSSEIRLDHVCSQIDQETPPNPALKCFATLVYEGCGFGVWSGDLENASRKMLRPLRKCKRFPLSDHGRVLLSRACKRSRNRV